VIGIFIIRYYTRCRTGHEVVLFLMIADIRLFTICSVHSGAGASEVSSSKLLS
jgi:hypothetical protein